MEKFGSQRKGPKNSFYIALPSSNTADGSGFKTLNGVDFFAVFFFPENQIHLKLPS